MRNNQDILRKLNKIKVGVSQPNYNKTQKDIVLSVNNGTISDTFKKVKGTHSVSLKYLLDVHCFSELTKEELKKFTSFCKTLREMKSIVEIKNTTFYPTSSKNNDALSSTLIEEIKKSNTPIEEIEHYCLSNKARIHGFWSPDKVFELLIIDPEHGIHNKEN